ncbi:uncharacterized protein LOC128954713 [Oppia nitens]|uniref:uncharacterized protein LOC128954713 n=1 Tax=Oppia nitens TaxID=1686743 RepID=UPI0023DB7B2F|nr:uncharacterized protein LOC128954713 [Oppia nitens]
MSRQTYYWSLTGLLIKSYYPMLSYDHRCRYQLPTIITTTTTTTTTLSLLSQPLLLVLAANSLSKLFDATNRRLRCAHQLSTIDQIFNESQSKILRLDVIGSCGYLGGTGTVIFKSDGLVLTCAHMVEDIRQAIAYFNDLPIVWQGSRRARVLYVEPFNDLALLQIIYDGAYDQLRYVLNQFAIGQQTANFGDDIVCFGYPTEQLTVTDGYIACPQCIQSDNTGTTWVTLDSGHNEHRSGAYSGFSGGPVQDLDGQLVGIFHSCCEIIRRRATPCTKIQEFMQNASTFNREQRLIKHNGKRDVCQRNRLDDPIGGHHLHHHHQQQQQHQLRRRRLQIEVCWYNSANSIYYRIVCARDGRQLRSRNVYLNGKGIFVYQFFNDTQGNVSLIEFDAIIKINGKPVESIGDLSRALAMNTTVRLTIVRYGKEKEVDVNGEQLTNDFNYI